MNPTRARLLNSSRLHWTHLALRALLQVALSRRNFLEALTKPREVDLDLDPEAKPDEVDGADAQDLIDSEIAEATRKAFERYGTGPVHPAAFGASDNFYLAADQAFMLLRLCRAIRTEDRLKTIAAPNALTIVEGKVDEHHLPWSFVSAFLPGWRCTQRYVNEPERIFVADMVQVGSKHPRYSMTSILGMRNPILLSMEEHDEVPEPIASATTLRLKLVPPDRTLLIWMIAIRHPDTPRAELDRLRRRLPSKKALSEMREDMLLAAFRAPTARDTVRALNAAAKPLPAPSDTGLRLADLVGYGTAKTTALQIVEDLLAWKRGELPWSDVCRGLLLYGPPGTGKTELARAMAREPGINFVAGNHTTWQAAGHLGEALKAMDRTFLEARARTPCILWIDEIDSFGSRTASSTQNRSYDTKFINGLLAHLDGITERDGVVILGACNHPQMLDEAIKRAGRFDHHAYIGLPDRDDLAVILRQHLGEDLPEADLKRLAVRANGRSGADCAGAIRVARSNARGKRRPLEERDLEAALGGTGARLTEEQIAMTAYHEAGHAIVATALSLGVPSSLRIDDNGGLFSITDEVHPHTPEDYHRFRAVDLAGRAAERLAFGRVGFGAGGEAGSDLAKATLRALREELSYGTGSNGNLYFCEHVDTHMLLGLPQTMRDHVQRRVDEALTFATEILEANRAHLDSLAANLIAYRIVADEELHIFLDPVVFPGEVPQ
ncbi:AAA family ATPase [Cereibacter sp. SYSU M97828]|nr:AAA family ATPase [Cereibacter flavus]